MYKCLFKLLPFYISDATPVPTKLSPVMLYANATVTGVNQPFCRTSVVATRIIVMHMLVFMLT